MDRRSDTRHRLEARLARDADEVRQAQALRYRVFVEELGGGGDGVDHAARLEADAFDPWCRHLLLIDREAQGAPVVGVYRLMDNAAAARAGRFYSETEYDLGALRASGRRLLELGRSCLDPAWRGGAGMMYLWLALARIVEDEGVEVLFGTASFHGTDLAALAPMLSLLHHRHLAPPDICPRSLQPPPVALPPEAGIDRAAATLGMPALIKAYLRLGGFVGDGAYVDAAFNTTDVCLVLDTARMNDRQRAIYARGID
jgi:putative hemolysin